MPYESLLYGMFHFFYRRSIFSTEEYGRAPWAQNCAFSLLAFEMGGSGSSGRDPFCTLTL